MSSLKGQLSLRLFSDQSASMLGVYSCLKSLPWNCKRKGSFSLNKCVGLGSVQKILMRNETVLIFQTKGRNFKKYETV